MKIKGSQYVFRMIELDNNIKGLLRFSRASRCGIMKGIIYILTAAAVAPWVIFRSFSMASFIRSCHLIGGRFWSGPGDWKIACYFTIAIVIIDLCSAISFSGE